MPKSRAAILLCCIALAAPGIACRAEDSPNAPISPQAAHDLLHQLDDAFVSVFEKVAPAVVIIKADKKPSGDDQDQNFDFYFHSPDGEGGHPQHMPEPAVRSEGSGFIVRQDGYIYTNCHVIEDSEKIDVTLRDHRHFAARLVGADERTDIAVLKIEATNLPVASLVDSDSVRVGQMCFAIGIPYNLDYSFCRGVVSGKGRGNLTSTVNNPMYEDYIQTDAFINPGNSGGPLFDIDGRVMGMNTLINGIGRGLSFAIPSNMLGDVGGEIIATGRVTHPWLGITVRGLDEELDDDPAGTERFRGVGGGVCVDTIEANAPAYKSDLRPKDVITKVDGIPVLTANDLQHEILRKKVGESVHLSIWRSGKAFDIALVTDALPADLSQVVEAHPQAKVHPSDSTSYGLEFGHPGGQTQPVRDKLNEGAAVTAVVSDSPAGRAGVHPGDIITAVDEKPVSDPTSCLEILAAHRGASGPVILYNRDGQKTRAVLDTGGADNPEP
jgi:S1-C subfamily serine protease